MKLWRERRKHSFPMFLVTWWSCRLEHTELSSANSGSSDLRKWKFATVVFESNVFDRSFRFLNRLTAALELFFFLKNRVYPGEVANPSSVSPISWLPCPNNHRVSLGKSLYSWVLCTNLGFHLMSKT